MTQAPGDSPMVVRDEAAARVLMDVRARPALLPFLGREMSLAVAAREAGLPASTLAYRLRQFQRLGLVAHVGVAARKGRPVRYYRGPHAYFVPFTATPLTTSSALSDAAFVELQRLLMASVGAAWDEATGTDREIGLHLFRDSRNRLSWNVEPYPDGNSPDAFFRDLLRPEQPAVWNQMAGVRLTQEAAKALQTEIATLMDRYAPSKDEPAREYIVRLAMAPMLQADRTGRVR